MSTIGGPGGIDGPKGPSGPDGPGGIEGPEEIDGGAGPDAVGDARAAGEVGATRATGGASDVDALAAEVAAGRLTPREAVDRLVETMAGPELGQAERTELREMLTDLVANDPHLAGLAGRV